jgi:DNA-binding transcriptional LysR family regulator
VTVSLHLYASQQYLQEHGAPQTTAELERHRLVVFGEYGHAPSPSVNWLMEIGGQVGRHRPDMFTVNSVYGMLRAVESGVGIGALPDYMIGEVPTLARVLPELAGPTVDAYFVYPEELRHSKRIAVFRDYLVARVAETRF